MKVHPSFAKRVKTQSSAETVMIDGYVAASNANMTTLCKTLGGDVCFEVPTAQIVRDEELAGDASGKARLVVEATAPVAISVQARARQVLDASGTYCGGSGTMYCWERIRTPDGTYVIVMVPCGSCIPSVMDGGVFLP
jgi:hypothetical protein